MTDCGGIAPITLAFHKISDSLTWSVTNYAPARLEHLLDCLQSRGWNLKSGADSSGDTEEGRGRLTLSFDDGYEHLLDILPALMGRYRFQPIVLVPTDLLGKENRWDYSYRLRVFRHLSVDSLKRLAESGAVIGSHGVSHCDLTGCNRAELRRELNESRKTLQDITGQPVVHISYPFGRFNDRVLEAAGEAGFETGFTMNFPKPSDRPLQTGRIPIYSFDTGFSVTSKLGSGIMSLVERTKARIVNRLSGGTILLNRLSG